MLLVAFISLACVFGTGAEVVFTATPEQVDPGNTPVLNLRCSVQEVEEGTIVSISILRRTIAGKNANSNVLIAELTGTAPNVPIVAAGFETLTVQGQIAQLESELGTYLEITWPTPGVYDLGQYTCEVTNLGEEGGQVLFAVVTITTSNPVTDKLLVALLALQDEVRTLNNTVLQIVNTTSARGEDAVPEVTATSATPIDAQEIPPVVEIDETPTEIAAVTRPADEDLGRLAAAVESLQLKFDQFNETLVRIDDQVSTLVQEELEDDRNETSVDQVEVDVIRNYFVSENISNFLFQANQNTDFFRAQSVCEARGLNLATIRDSQELLAIQDQISPYVQEGNLVLIGSEGTVRDDTYRITQEQVTSSGWEPVERLETVPSGCFALQRGGGSVNIVQVSCFIDQDDVFFLCQRDLN